MHCIPVTIGGSVAARQAQRAAAREKQGEAAARPTKPGWLDGEARLRLANSLIHGKNDNGVPYFQGYQNHVEQVVRDIQEAVLKSTALSAKTRMAEAQIRNLAEHCLNGANDHGARWFRGYAEHVGVIIDQVQAIVFEGIWPAGFTSDPTGIPA